jgi:hypothetical protein
MRGVHCERVTLTFTLPPSTSCWWGACWEIFRKIFLHSSRYKLCYSCYINLLDMHAIIWHNL